MPITIQEESSVTALNLTRSLWFDRPVATADAAARDVTLSFRWSNDPSEF